MSLRLFAGLLTITLSVGFVIPAAAQEILPFPPEAVRQHSRADHAGIIYSRAPTCEPSREGCRLTF